MATAQKIIDVANENTQQRAMGMLQDADGNGLGFIIAGLVPQFLVRTGLTSSATHTEERPGIVHAAMTEAGDATLALVFDSGGAGAGEVLVEYTAGVPTLTFGDGAVTGYQVLKQELPKGIVASLAATAL